MTSTGLVLFTRDLRLTDNPVLHAALEHHDQVVPLFVLDRAITERGLVSPNRAAFLADALRDLDESLRAREGKLVFRTGDVVEETAAVVEQVEAAAVYLAADVSAFAHRRAERLRERLERAGAELVVVEETVTAIAPGRVLPTSSDHFAVFTPYYRRWIDVDKRKPLAPPDRLAMPRIRAGDLPKPADIATGSPSPELPEGGESAGRKVLAQWLDGPVQDYEARHDDLAGDGTSRLSSYLHFGCLSAAEIVHRCDQRHDGPRALVRQLAWRDFHHQVLAARPDAARHDYRTHHDHWRTSREHIQAWKTGHTGYPIVDAGMRQLEREGWMHNRARLIVGSFLTKTLYVDWRVGAEHFESLLIDADVANNRLNWQWVAGTGTDTRPNRVLNPLRQAERFDPDGEFVRRYVPELSSVDGGAVHEPWALPMDQRAELNYPDPIVDLREAGRRFRDARDSG